jgi:hypothetical protein
MSCRSPGRADVLAETHHRGIGADLPGGEELVEVDGDERRGGGWLKGRAYQAGSCHCDRELDQVAAYQELLESAHRPPVRKPLFAIT